MSVTIEELRERHKSERGYPMARHPKDGHTYTAVVERFCRRCYAPQPCDVNLALDLANGTQK